MLNATLKIAGLVAAGALVAGGGTAAAMTTLASHGTPATVTAPATAQPPKVTAPPATRPPVRPAPKPAVKKPAPAPVTHNGPVYNGPVTIINEAPAPSSTVYVPIPDSAPYYATTNQAVVQQYYDYLNAKDFSSAWAMGGRYIGGGDYAGWVAGYSTTSYVALAAWDYYPGYNAVGVAITATQTDGTVRTYSGSYTVNGGAVTSASITQTSGGSSGTAAPAGLRYVGDGVYANSATSDAFALSVEQAAAASGYAYSITAYSPATGRSYTLTQTGTSPYVYQTGTGSVIEFGS